MVATWWHSPSCRCRIQAVYSLDYNIGKMTKLIVANTEAKKNWVTLNTLFAMSISLGSCFYKEFTDICEYWWVAYMPMLDLVSVMSPKNLIGSYG
jgi:hypothetical protein